MTDSTLQRGSSLLRFAYTVFVAVTILLLICSGGMVTSKDAGLSVPDWPNSYGYNMFTFPVARWVGGIFFEHTHRLLASFVGLQTVGLAVWFAREEPRRWVRNLGYLAVFAVVLQGLFGGLRVTQLKDWIGVPHALLAQAFFALMSFIALTQSRWWQRLGMGDKTESLTRRLRPLCRHVVAITILIFLQLGLGAAMRHAHAGLSITDFPKAYGHWWPQVHKADLPAINAERIDVLHLPPTSLAQIHLQMTHRLLAVVIFLGVAGAGFAVWKRRDSLAPGLRVLGVTWPLVLSAQVVLGMYTIWTSKAADVATAHVAIGATSLVWGVILYSGLRRWSAAPAWQPELATAEVAR